MKHNIESCGHEYEVRPDTFLSDRRKCPECSKKEKSKKMKTYVKKGWNY